MKQKHDVTGSGLNTSEEQRVDLLRRNTMADMVFLLIWRAHQISRADIARQLGLSRSTVTEIIKNFIETDFVNEVGAGASRGGRRPVVLEFQDDARIILGIDIGATHVSVALTDLRGGVLAWQEKRFPTRENPKDTRTLVLELCDACLAAAKYRPQRLVGIGVAFPSPVDPGQPDELPESVIPAWGGRTELKRLEDYYGVPVTIDNDANLGALAEQRWGAGRGLDHLIYIKIGYGIGSGLILGGEIYRGAMGVAGEIGHLPVHQQGNHCGCGLRGCLGTYVGVPALETRVLTLLSDNPNSMLAGDIPPTITDIENAALQGDTVALHVVREATEYLGIAVAALCNVLNPNMVVLGGGLVRLGDLILKPLREKVDSCTLVRSAAADIQTSTLGSKAVAIGAASLALENAFAEPHFYQR